MYLLYLLVPEIYLLAGNGLHKRKDIFYTVTVSREQKPGRLKKQSGSPADRYSREHQYENQD